MSAKRSKIVVIGSANIDLVTCVARSPRPGESMLGKSFSTVCGGKGANQAIAAARLGAEVCFVGCVGNDVFGQMQRESLQAARVGCTFLRVHENEPTGTAIILVEDSGQNTIVVTPAANMTITSEDIEAAEQLIADADAVLLQLEIPLESVELALDLSMKHGVPSFLDAGPAQKVPNGLLAKAGIVSPNETEAETLTGKAITNTSDAEEVAKMLHRMGVKEVVLKLGERGAYYSGGVKHWVEAYKVNVVDSTAAGDVFTAALAIAWPEGIESAMRFASAAAALSVTRAGAQPSIPFLAEVEAFMIGQFQES